MKKFAKILFVMLVVCVLACTAVLCFGCGKKEEPLKHYQLSNPNATIEAQRLYDYVWSVSGKKILSGQQESTWMEDGGAEYEMNYLFANTGKYPAIRGFDFIEDDFDGCVARAKAWAERGGIVTICWHCSSDFDGGYNDCKGDTLTEAQWTAMFTEGTPEHTATLEAMDKAGRALLELKEAGIPVLWRPFHEFDGSWFWWGKGKNAPDHFKQLWIMMYNHFVNDLHLDNLIWVLGYSVAGVRCKAYYPGDEYCDIAGGDSYYVNLNGAEERLYEAVYSAVADRKPLVLHECGLIPTVEEFKEVPWAWFMTWHTNYLTEENTVESLNALYNSNYVITLDELPNLYN